MIAPTALPPLTPLTLPQAQVKKINKIFSVTAFYSFHIPFTLKHLRVIICVRSVNICFCVVCLRALILSTRHGWWKSWRTQRATGEEAGIAWPALSMRAALRPARKWVWAWNGMGWVQIHYSWVNTFDDLSGATWSFQNRHSECGLLLNSLQMNTNKYTNTFHNSC